MPGQGDPHNGGTDFITLVGQTTVSHQFIDLFIEGTTDRIPVPEDAAYAVHISGLARAIDGSYAAAWNRIQAVKRQGAGDVEPISTGTSGPDSQVGQLGSPTDILNELGFGAGGIGTDYNVRVRHVALDANGDILPVVPIDYKFEIRFIELP